MSEYKIKRSEAGLRDHLFQQCEKLSDKKISLAEVKGHADLARQINNTWNIENAKANLKFKMKVQNV